MSQDDMTWMQLDQELGVLGRDLDEHAPSGAAASAGGPSGAGEVHLLHLLLRHARASGQKIRSLEARMAKLEQRVVERD